MLVLAFGFGLSMDYEVFLLSRIVELHEHGHSTNEAVRLGLQRSGKIIITSARCSCASSSAGSSWRGSWRSRRPAWSSCSRVIDATLVRMLLVPATMSVEWNWSAPRWMKRLHARSGITEQVGPAGAGRRARSLSAARLRGWPLAVVAAVVRGEEEVLQLDLHLLDPGHVVQLHAGLVRRVGND